MDPRLAGVMMRRAARTTHTPIDPPAKEATVKIPAAILLSALVLVLGAGAVTPSAADAAADPAPEATAAALDAAPVDTAVAGVFQLLAPDFARRGAPHLGVRHIEGGKLTKCYLNTKSLNEFWSCMLFWW